MIGMTATLKHEVYLLAVSQIPPHGLDVHIVEGRLDYVQHLDGLQAGSRTELVLHYFIENRLCQVSAPKDTGIMDGIEFLGLGYDLKLVAKKFHGKIAAID
jgi:hypothetical protein